MSDMPRYSELSPLWDGNSIRDLWWKDRVGTMANAWEERLSRKSQRIMVLRSALLEVWQLIQEGDKEKAEKVIARELHKIETEIL